MCELEYCKFGSCGHYGIEYKGFCSKALWFAGLHGSLQPCLPDICSRLMDGFADFEYNPPQSVEFIDFTGPCGMCIFKNKLPPQIRNRGYADKTILYWPDISNLFEYAPYILIDSVVSTIPHLLGIEDQVMKTHKKLGPALLFPQQLVEFTWWKLVRSQLCVHATWLDFKEPVSVVDIHRYLRCMGGFVYGDKQIISNALKNGQDPKAIMNNHDPYGVYMTIFEPRGMPYSHYCRAIDVILQEARDLDHLEKHDNHTASKEYSSLPVPIASALTELTATPAVSTCDLPKQPSNIQSTVIPHAPQTAQESMTDPDSQAVLAGPVMTSNEQNISRVETIQGDGPSDRNNFMKNDRKTHTFISDIKPQYQCLEKGANGKPCGKTYELKGWLVRHIEKYHKAGAAAINKVITQVQAQSITIPYNDPQNQKGLPKLAPANPEIHKTPVLALPQSQRTTQGATDGSLAPIRIDLTNLDCSKSQGGDVPQPVVFCLPKSYQQAQPPSQSYDPSQQSSVPLGIRPPGLQFLIPSDEEKVRSEVTVNQQTGQEGTQGSTAGTLARQAGRGTGSSHSVIVVRDSSDSEDQD